MAGPYSIGTWVARKNKDMNKRVAFPNPDFSYQVFGKRWG